MIIFKGSRDFHGVTFLIFVNEHGSEIEVSVDSKIAKHFLLAFSRLSPPEPKKVEAPEDVPSV